jgi:NitT/TauT family transport system substrate-binding protein
MAVQALEARQLDGFWANALGSETAVRRGVGKVLVNVRHGDGPPVARDYTFSALVTTEALIASDPEPIAAAMRAIASVQRVLRADPAQVAVVGQRRFSPAAATVITTLVERDVPFHDPIISKSAVAALNRFGHALGLLATAVPYEQVVATRFYPLWQGEP